MALSGPEAEATQSHDGYARHTAPPPSTRSAPKVSERDPTPVVDPAPSAPKFGPAIIFKQLDGGGGS
jgi:hypothetical protein